MTGPSGVWDVHINVTDANAEHDALRTADVAIERGPAATEYDMLEIEIVDPDGYRICIGSAMA